jgi:hypothetical protein
MPAPFASAACGLTHPPQALSDVRRADARRAKIGGCDGISQCFQVSANSVEPVSAKRARNLLSKDDWRAALRDEAVELRPEVSLVVGAALLAGCAERLTGAGAGPERLVVSHSSKSSCMGPDANAGEEVRLRVATKVIGLHLDNRPLVHIARRNQSGADEVAQPLSRVRLNLVVVGRH